MAGDTQHLVPGERLSRRLTSRTARRPRMGMSPAFYLRFGMEDPWLQGGLPTGPVGADHDADFGFSYVSRRAYDKHLMSLAWARRRRDDRMERLTTRYGVSRLKAASRRWPGESKRRKFSFGLVSVSERDMILPPSPVTMAAAEDEEGSSVPVVSAFGGRKDTRGGRAKPQAWFTREHVPTKVFKTPRSPVALTSSAAKTVIVEREGSASLGGRASVGPRARSLDQVGERLASVVRAAHPVARELERVAQTASSPRVRHEIRRVLEQVVELPPEQQVVVVRRVLRTLGPSARMVRTEVVNELADTGVSASAVAQGRMETRAATGGGRRRGLRPVMGRSPLMNELRPDLAPPEAAEARTTPAGAGAPGGRAASRLVEPRADRGAVVDERPAATVAAARPERALRDLRASAAGRAAMRLHPAHGDRLLPPPVRGSVSVAERSQLLASPVARSRFSRGEASADLPGGSPSAASARVAARFGGSGMDLAQVLEGSGSESANIVHQPAGQTLGLRRHSVVRTARGAYMPAATVVQHELPAASEVAGSGASSSSSGARVVRGLGTHGSSRRELEKAALETAARELLSRSGVPRELRPSAQPATTGVLAPRAAAALPATGTIAAPQARAGEARGAAVPWSRHVALPAARSHAATGRSSTAAAHASARAGVGQARPGSLSPVVSVAHTMAPSGQLSRLPATIGRAITAAARTPQEVGSIASVVAAVQEAPTAERAERLLNRLPPVVRAAVRAEAGAAVADSVLTKAIPGKRQLGAVLAEGAGTSASQQAVARVAASVAPSLSTRALRMTAPMAQLARPEADAAEVEGPERRSEGGTRVIQNARVEGVQSTTRTFVTPRRSGEAAVSRPVRLERELRPVAPMVAASERSSMAPTVVNTVIRVLVDGLDVPESVARQVVRRTRPSPAAYARGASPARSLEVDLRPLTRLLAEESRAAAPSGRGTSQRRMRAYAPTDTVIEPVEAAGSEAARPSEGARVVRGLAADKTPPPVSTTRVARAPASAPGVGRPLDWMGDRARSAAVSSRASSRRPSFTESGERDSTGQIMARAGSHKTPTNQWVARDLGKGSDGRFQSVRNVRPARNAAVTSELTLPEGASGTPTVERSLETLAAATPQELNRQLAALPRSSRSHLTDTLAAVDSRQAGGDLPGWASRASGLPNVSGDGGQLLTALARATEVEEIVRVIMDQGGALKTVQSSLPKPVIQVIEQIRAEAKRPGDDEGSGAPQDLSRGVSRSAYRQASRSSAQVIKGFKALRPSSSAGAAPSGAAANQLSKLSKRLKELIHLAEGGQRGEARRHVRMAEDSAAARQEGQSAPNSADTVGGQQVDVEALGREVLEVVSRELEMRRERRMGESDDFWW